MGENFFLGVIPARWNSLRFPGKPLYNISGKPLIQHVWDKCTISSKLDFLVVATDDDRIFDAVKEFGGEVLMTKSDHNSGTDRAAEAVKSFPNATHVINIQGDEPLIKVSLINSLIDELNNNDDISVVTAVNPTTIDDKELINPNVVKVVVSKSNKALYFSRRMIPYDRDNKKNTIYYKHKGIYGFKKEYILEFVSLPPAHLETIEGLEQLRIIENGTPIQVILTDDDSYGIDTLEQAIKLNNKMINK